MKLGIQQFRDKLAGCWAGKNIGGVLGAPFEGQRKVQNATFYTQDLSMGPPPNDDLDLQIVWLAAVERYGRNVNASILGDYWLSYVIPNWVEYGTGKANLRAGLVPPMSGYVDNTYRDSNGCWIRSEVWACLAPGHPEIATRYAYEDAIVDHAGEGMYGEIFFAAMESAAFVESDIRKLIDIGLSYIPEDSVTTKAINKAIECYENKVEFMELRKQIHNTAPGTFGIQGCTISDIPKEGNEGLELGAPGFDAPENVAFTVAAFLYGEGDFGKSITMANAFGEDTDCTCATLGAIMGIILGNSGLPEKWTKPLDDKIVTMCINKTWGGIWVPDTATQLAERILRDVPGFLGQEICDAFAEGGMVIDCKEGDELYCGKMNDYIPYINGGSKDKALPIRDLCKLSPFVARYEFPAFSVRVDLGDSVSFKAGEERKFKVTVINSHTMRQQQWARITMYLPEGAKAVGPSAVELPLNNNYMSQAEVEFTVSTEFFTGSKLEIPVDIALPGRHSDAVIKVVLMCGN